MARLKGKWLDYETASIVAKRMGCRSIREYREWHDSAHPSNMPKHPEKVYSEWTSFNDFLGTKNTFHPMDKGDFRDYWEAVRWSQRNAQENGLKSSTQWFNWVRNNEDKLPDDISRRPDRVYDQWEGWPVWLGVSLQEKVMAAKRNVGVMALCYNSGMPKNYVEVLVIDDGFAKLKEMVADRRMQVFKVFVWERELGEQVRKVFEMFASDQGNSVWLSQNVDTLVFELSMVLEVYNPNG